MLTSYWMIIESCPGKMIISSFLRVSGFKP
jgi:hypothetical protein